MDIDTLLNKHSDHYRFHGVRATVLYLLVAQLVGGVIRLWGRDHDDFVDGEDDASRVQGEGYLYATDIRGIELSYSEFCQDDGLVLVLEQVVEDEPQEWYPRPGDHRERLIRVEEWKVVGGLRPVLDEDEDVIDQEAFSVEEIAEMYS